MGEMTGGMGTELLLLLPEALLAAFAVAGLLLGSFLPRNLQWVVRAFAAVGVLSALVATLTVWGKDPTTVFDASYAIDSATNATRIIVTVSVLVVLALSAPETRNNTRESEFVVLLLLGGLGAVLLSGTSDLMLLVGAYLLASVPLYALTGFAKDPAGTEATMKYYLLGALFGTTMLFGATIVFGIGGATAYHALAETASAAPQGAFAIGAVALLAGLLFKAGAVPTHFGARRDRGCAPSRRCVRHHSAQGRCGGSDLPASGHTPRWHRVELASADRRDRGRHDDSRQFRGVLPDERQATARLFDN